MKFALLFFIFSGTAFAKTINFDAFKVDTSTADLKPEKQVIIDQRVKLLETSSPNEAIKFPVSKKSSVTTPATPTSQDRMNHLRSANPLL